jgi:hypothetical protein
MTATRSGERYRWAASNPGLRRRENRGWFRPVFAAAH